MKKLLCLLLICMALCILLSACDLPVATNPSTPGTTASTPSGTTQKPSEPNQSTSSTQPTTPTEPSIPTEPKPTEPKPTEPKPTEPKDPTVPSEPVHTCAPTGQWLSDKDNHWHLCSCGSTLDLAPHTMQDNVCSVCGAEQPLPDRPIDPPDDLKAHSKFDKNACSALFGVWEVSQTQSTADMGLTLDQHITVTMTVRITFTEDGIQVMQMITDEEAYYQFMLVSTVENMYLKLTGDGKTREEVDAELAQQGTSVKKMAEESLSNRKLLPDDGYFWFYVENGVLYYGGNDPDSVQQIRISVTDKELIFLAEGDGEDQVLTKKA